MTEPEAKNLVRLLADLWPSMDKTGPMLDLWLGRLRPYDYSRARKAIEDHRVDCRFNNPDLGAVLGKLGAGRKTTCDHLTILADRARTMGMSPGATPEQILAEHWGRAGAAIARRRGTASKWVCNRAINETMTWVGLDFHGAAIRVEGWLGQRCDESIADWEAQEERQAQNAERIRAFIDGGGSPTEYMRRRLEVGVGGSA